MLGMLAQQTQAVSIAYVIVLEVKRDGPWCACTF